MVADEAENEKDIATEKEQATVAAAPVAIAENSDGDSAADKSVVIVENGTNSNMDETATTLLNETGKTIDAAAAAAVTEEGVAAVEDATVAAAAADEDSNKKPKKEKKKKWSFRSFSFSKKDKQKPTKKEDATTAAAAAATATNGECEKVPEEVSSVFFLLCCPKTKYSFRCATHKNIKFHKGRL